MTIEWVRPGERPEWGRDDIEWWWCVDDFTRVVTEDERGHRCSTRGCTKVAIAVFQRTFYWLGSVRPRRQFACAEHFDLYGKRLIEDGRVLVTRPRMDRTA